MNPIFRNALEQARLPSIVPHEVEAVPNHWREEKNLERKNGLATQKYNDPKTMSCLAKMRALLGEYTYSESSMIKEIIEADYDVTLAINYLLGERVIQRNKGKRMMPVEKAPDGSERFVRNDLPDLPDEKTQDKIYENSLYNFTNIIHPLDDCASHVQDYVQDSMEYYQSVGYGVRQKKAKDKSKDPEKKKKKNKKEADEKL